MGWAQNTKCRSGKTEKRKPNSRHRRRLVRISLAQVRFYQIGLRPPTTTTIDGSFDQDQSLLPTDRIQHTSQRVSIQLETSVLTLDVERERESRRQLSRAQQPCQKGKRGGDLGPGNEEVRWQFEPECRNACVYCRSLVCDTKALRGHAVAVNSYN